MPAKHFSINTFRVFCFIYQLIFIDAKNLYLKTKIFLHHSSLINQSKRFLRKTLKTVFYFIPLIKLWTLIYQSICEEYKFENQIKFALVLLGILTKNLNGIFQTF